MNRLVRLALSLVLATGFVQGTARATTLSPLTVEQLTDASTWIVEGTVLSVWAEVDENGQIWTRARVRVDTVHKGVRLPDTVVVDTLGGTLGQVHAPMEAAPRFSPDEPVLLFLSEIDHGRRLTTVDMMLGKYTIRRPAGERRLIAQQFDVPEELPYDHRFLPYPAPDRRIYLDDLLGRIEGRLDIGWQGEKIPGISAAQLTEINTPERRLRR